VRAQVGGIKHCLGVDALNTRSNTLMRFVAPVTLLATGGAGQARPRGALALAPARM
jgi:L-aspartate oxidase